MKRRTITAHGLNDAFAYINRFMKGTNMAEYDNSNQVALWPRDNTKGVWEGGGDKADFNGETIRNAVLITRSRRTSDNQPAADLWWQTDSGAHQAAIFKGADGKLGGKIDGWWVNIYDNRPAEGRSPEFRAKFKAMDVATSTPPEQEAVAAGGVDEIPF